MTEESRIARIRAVAEEYAAMGYSLSVRQLFYRLLDPLTEVAPPERVEPYYRVDGTPPESDYRELNELVMNAKIERALSWHLVDEPREQHVEWPPQTTLGYEDPWDSERWRPEVWIEKVAACSGIREVCCELVVPWLICSPTQSMISRAAGRLRSYAEDFHQAPAVILATDYDPEGLQMRVSIATLLRALCRFEMTIYPVAITREQVSSEHLRSSPGAVRDREYIRQHGDFAWELESLDPRALRKAVADTLHALKVTA